MLTLILAIACADIAPDDTATSLGYADEKGRHLDGVRFSPERADLRLFDVLSTDVVVSGNMHVVAHFCDPGLFIGDPEWVHDGDVLTVSWVPVAELLGDYTCTLITPIGRLTIPVLVE